MKYNININKILTTMMKYFINVKNYVIVNAKKINIKLRELYKIQNFSKRKKSQRIYFEKEELI